MPQDTFEVSFYHGRYLHHWFQQFVAFLLGLLPHPLTPRLKILTRLLFHFTINTEEWCGFFLGVLGTAGQKSWSSLRAWTSAVPSPESIMHACQGQGRSIIRADATHPPGSRYG